MPRAKNDKCLSIERGCVSWDEEFVCVLVSVTHLNFFHSVSTCSVQAKLKY